MEGLNLVSNDASRIIFNIKTISIAIVISLIVGAGAGYIFGNSPVLNLKEEKDELLAEFDSLSLTFKDLEAELNSTQLLLDAEHRSTELYVIKYMNLLQEVIELEAEYDSLLLAFQELTDDLDSAEVRAQENQVFKQQVIDLESEIASLQNSYEKLQLLYSVLEQEYNSLQLARGQETWLTNDNLVIETILGAVDIRYTDSIKYVAIHPSDIDIINATIELGELIMGVDAKMVEGQEFNGSMTEFVRYFNVTRTDKRTSPQVIVGFRRGWIDLLGRCYVYEGWDLL